ncbi:MAG: hypothetical protein HGB12_09680 [Bacteroidetes bacterium]|nr:hypothetical protein [Bacteroidota bacterium]
MKNISAFLFIFCCALGIITFTLCFNLSAQSVGINTTGNEADASALLEIGNGNNDTKGLLIPRVALTSNTDGTTIVTPATSLLVYNTNESVIGGSGTGFYYNSGTTISPNWVRLVSGSAVTSVTGTYPISIATGTSAPVISVATNSQSSDGVITAGGSNNSMVWKTDASGNPAWRPDANSEGTITSITAGSGLNGGTITGSGTISLSTPVSVSNGGTGVSSLTNNGVLYGGSNVGVTSAGSSGQILTNNSGTPVWTTATYPNAAGTSGNVLTSDGTNWTSVTPSGSPTFGDGSDGDVTIAGTTTLTRDMYYNNLVVTGTLITGNWRIFVKNTLSGTGTIKQNGNNGGNGVTPSDPGGTCSTGGAGGSGGAPIIGYFTSVGGGNGTVGGGCSPGGDGANGTSVIASLAGPNGAMGGKGGDGNDEWDGGVVGNGGTATPVINKFGIVALTAILGIDNNVDGTTVKINYSGGASGGTGGGSNHYGGSRRSGGGGGAGGAGGIIYILANVITGTFNYEAIGGNGGNGGNGCTGGAGGGGGAGGNGGIIVLIYRNKTAWSGSYTLTAGTGGTGGTSGTHDNGDSGANGTNGTHTEIFFDSLLR